MVKGLYSPERQRTVIPAGAAGRPMLTTAVRAARVAAVRSEAAIVACLLCVCVCVCVFVWMSVCEEKGGCMC